MAKPPPRLFVEEPLGDGVNLPLDGPGWHYLHTVLRMGTGDPVLVFNGRDGEWRAEISAAEKRRGVITAAGRQREQLAPPPLTLLFAPLKKDPNELVIQKGTELGVTVFQPVITARTILPKGGLKKDRLDLIAMEAAEQCERLELPTICDPLSMNEALGGAGGIVFCDEAGDDDSERWGGSEGRGVPLVDALASSELSVSHILIGPEGGFTPEERAALRARPDTLAVSLGPRILKAETAAIAALTLWQATRGDWR